MSSYSKIIMSSEQSSSSPKFVEESVGIGGWVPRLSQMGEWVGFEAPRILRLYYMEVMPGVFSYIQQYRLAYSADGTNFVNIS